MGECTLPTVRIVEQRLIQVLLNLLINAERVADRIQIRTGPVGDGAVEFVIEDNGPGIADEISRTLFNAFVTHREDGVGTGLGLYLCKRFITEAGGTIGVDRGSLGGARFRFVLPEHTDDGTEVRPMSGVPGATMSTQSISSGPAQSEPDVKPAKQGLG